MGFTRFFSPTKTTFHGTENEMHGYHILRLEYRYTDTHCARWSDSEFRLVCRSPEMTLICISHVSNLIIVTIYESCITIMHTRT